MKENDFPSSLCGVNSAPSKTSEHQVLGSKKLSPGADSNHVQCIHLKLKCSKG